MPVSRQNDEATFLHMLFDLKGKRDHEAVVVPWNDKVAIISAHSHGNAEVQMGVFDIPLKDARKFVKLAAADSISMLSIPPLIARDLLKEGDTYNIAPHLYVIWAVGDGEPFHEYSPRGGYDYFSMTGILEAISEAEDIPYPDEERLQVSEKAMMNWMTKLTASKDIFIKKFGAFLKDIHGDGSHLHQDDEEEDISPSP